MEKGKSGFTIWRYRLEQIQDPEAVNDEVSEPESTYLATPRAVQIIQRIVRDTALSRYVKTLYKYTCQVCQVRLITNAGFYAEAAHIQPLGNPHNGPDNLGNLLCLCPNHHAQLDLGGYSISDDLQLLGLDGRLMVDARRHRIATEFVRYHREHFYLNR
ncbi:HNH endonuclease [Spirosoma taeanense]|uniref:HNH endonuclease n=1 Tax=Spirosoma taeanense TaxID=2735870 RepID=UPI001F049F71|nr:HNH endonuclease [Spirosoma taeanense]